MFYLSSPMADRMRHVYTNVKPYVGRINERAEDPESQVDRLSSVRVYSPKDMRPIEGRVRVQKSIAEVMKRFPDGIPLLNPEEDMKVEGSNFRKLVRRIEALEGMLAKHPLVRWCQALSLV